MSTLRRSVLWPVDGAAPADPPADAVPDAVILVSPTAADAARVAGWGTDVLVRDTPGRVPADVRAHVASYVLAAEDTDAVRGLVAQLEASDAAGSGASNGPGIELLIGTARAALCVRDLVRASARVRSVIVDPESLLDDLRAGDDGDVDPLAFPRGEALLAARGAGVPAVGRFAPRGHHAAAAGDMSAGRFSFALGFRGALCRSWDDVRVANREFVPSDESVDRARRVLTAMAEATAQGLGAISLDGRMIDLPFIRVSEELVALSETASARDRDAAARPDGRA